MERSLTDDSVTVNSLTQDVQKWTSSAERAMEIANNPNIESIWDDRKTRDWLRNNGFMISELDDDARRKALTRAINENLEEVVRFLITQVGNNRARRALVAEAMALSVSVNRLQILDSLIKEESSISSSTDIIDVRLKSGHTPLIAAILDGKEEIVQRLLERRANIEVRCIKEISPLTYAVKSRDPNIVRLLLQSRLVNEKPSVVDEKTADWTPLHFAVHYGERDIVDLLLDKGANIDALCSRGLPKDESTSDPLIDTNLKRLDTNGSISTVEACCTVLNRAIVKGDDLMVQLLLRRGAKIEAATPELASALSCAAEEQFEEIVDILLQKEANVNATDRWGWTALHRAQVKPENDNVTRLLLSKGSDVEARCEKGRTALHHAAERGNTSTIPLLIEKGANIEAKDIAENTPLHIAILYRHTDMVSLLVDQGADVKAKNGDGHNALTIATQDTEKQRKCPEIIEFLKKCSSILKVPSPWHRGILILAHRMNHNLDMTHTFKLLFNLVLSLDFIIILTDLFLDHDLTLLYSARVQV